MTQEEKNIKLAELEGWRLRWQNKGGGELFTEKPKSHCWEVWLPPQNYWNTEAGEAARQAIDYSPSPPDYFKDLNAVHLLEMYVEDRELWNRYTDELGIIRHYKADIHCLRSLANIIVSAKAKERCEAIGKTLNLW